VLKTDGRGRLTIWVSPEAVSNWTTDELTGEPGASPTYTDLVIETMATVQAIYGLAGRQTQGFLQSVFEFMKLDLTAPDHSTLSRRRRQLRITLPVKDWFKSRHLVVDSTGVKVYGEGERFTYGSARACGGDSHGLLSLSLSLVSSLNSAG
jgi:hypothetical protein